MWADIGESHYVQKGYGPAQSEEAVQHKGPVPGTSDGTSQEANRGGNLT
jgi:hypothetical protein